MTIQYVVTRTFPSRHRKRTYHISVGPFPTRARALGYMQRAIREYDYPPAQLTVSTLRPPRYDIEFAAETFESWGA
jgi:hypothetical protein